MPEAFDPYHRWLGVSPAEQPANHYRLLGIPLLETDAEVIQDAAERQMAHVRTYQLGPNSALSQRILNELAAAKACLLNPPKKAQYDEQLRQKLARDQVAAVQPPPVLPPPPPTQNGGTMERAEPLDPYYQALSVAVDRSRVVSAAQPPSTSPWPSWQILAAIAAGAAALVAIAGIIFSGEKKQQEVSPKQVAVQSKAEGASTPETSTPSKQVDKPPPGPKPPERKLPSVVEPTKKGEPTNKPPVPPPQDKPPPRPAAEPPGQIMELVKDAFAAAASSADYRAVAVDALKLVEQASAAGKQDLAKGAVTLALAAARKSGDDELVNKATLRILELGEKK